MYYILYEAVRENVEFSTSPALHIYYIGTDSQITKIYAVALQETSMMSAGSAASAAVYGK